MRHKHIGGDIFPQIFEEDTNDLWIVCEYVLPAKSKDFQYCFGMIFEKFKSFITACGKYHFDKNYFNPMPYDEYVSYINNNEYLSDFDEYIGDQGSIVIGDMLRIVNYGLTMRYGQPTIVLLDSGFNEDVWNNFYKRR